MKTTTALLCSALSTTLKCTAFQHTHRNHHTATAKSHLQSHDKSSIEALQTHPDTICWTQTLSQSPSSYIHPSLHLSIRPPSSGGTGIFTTAPIPENTTVISLNVDEAGIMDAYAIISDYKEYDKQDDEVMNMFVKLWYGIGSIKLSSSMDVEENDNSVNKDDVLSGILAHLSLTRYKDLSGLDVKEGFALEESRRLGHFLDSMPLLPQVTPGAHPFATNFIFWKDKEYLLLLNGTIARQFVGMEHHFVRISLREWSRVFLSEHQCEGITLTHIIDAIESAYACIHSRAFGRGANKKYKQSEVKDGHFIVPLVDKMNHDCEAYNVVWKSPMLREYDEREKRRNGDAVKFSVVTTKDVQAGEELLTTYGHRPCWLFAQSYGFLPRLGKERDAYSAIPFFPTLLDLDSESGTKLDLRVKANYEPLVKAVLAAVDKALKQKTDPRLIEESIIDYFLPSSLASRSQPLLIVCTRIGGRDFKEEHKITIEVILPYFRAAASAISQLQYNHQNGIKSPIKLKQMVMAAGLSDPNVNWDKNALKLIGDGIEYRLKGLRDGGKAAEEWLEQVSVHYIEEREIRAGFARDIRKSEVEVLEGLEVAVGELERNLIS